MADTVKLVELLRAKGLTIATAESCTGGMIASAIVDTPGASACFNEGYVTYANDAKVRILSVNPATLETFGAVSPQTADEMAKGLLLASEADIAVAVTGIAGPDGGTDEKPVGLVYISVGIKDTHSIFVKKHIFSGDRMRIRTQARDAAINMALELTEREL